jgi:hypothetical protein
MPWDFTLTSGNKAERTRRSRGFEGNRTTSPTVNPSVVGEAPAVMEDTDVTSPFQNLANDLAGFFGRTTIAQARVDEAKRLAEQEQKNQEAIVEARRRVWADPEGAKEAMRSGNFDKFVDK